MQLTHEFEKRASKPFKCDGCDLVIDRGDTYHHGLNVATNEPARFCRHCYEGATDQPTPDTLMFTDKFVLLDIGPHLELHGQSPGCLIIRNRDELAELIDSLTAWQVSGAGAWEADDA